MNEGRSKPAKVQAAPPTRRDVAHEVVAGMGVVRKPLFSAPIIYDGWQKQMLTHIAAAKQLGFTMFEIDTAEANVTRRKKKKEPEGNMVSMFSVGFGPGRIEGDEWKDGVVEPISTEGEMETIRTTIVTVYALAVE